MHPCRQVLALSPATEIQGFFLTKRSHIHGFIVFKKLFSSCRFFKSVSEPMHKMLTYKSFYISRACSFILTTYFHPLVFCLLLFCCLVFSGFVWVLVLAFVSYFLESSNDSLQYDNPRTYKTSDTSP